MAKYLAACMAAAGNVSSVVLSSCRQTTSGVDLFNQATRFGSRLFTLLMLNVAIVTVCRGERLRADTFAGSLLTRFRDSIDGYK